VDSGFETPENHWRTCGRKWETEAYTNGGPESTI